MSAKKRSLQENGIVLLQSCIANNNSVGIQCVIFEGLPFVCCIHDTCTKILKKIESQSDVNQSANLYFVMIKQLILHV